MPEFTRLRDRNVELANGSRGRNLDVPSFNPINYHEVISRPSGMQRITIDGKLFLPSGEPGNAPLPVVIVVPGSLGVAASHFAHAETLTNLGIAAFVLDPFGGRGIGSTVVNQAQYSFAASAYDVLAVWQVLTTRRDIDPTRTGAQGHSRGGSAVLTAAARRFADAVLGPGRGLKAVLAAYPWSGHQFSDPRVGQTEVRVLIGDRDEWCSPAQVQGHVQAMSLAGGRVSLRLVPGAAHSFDRDTAIERIAEASVAPGTPTAYIAEDGAFIHPLSSASDPALVDRDIMVYGLKAGYGIKGASIGSRPADARLFRDDMMAFWHRALLT